jgi:hypothetical protein
MGGDNLGVQSLMNDNKIIKNVAKNVTIDKNV